MAEILNVPFYAYKGDGQYIFISYSHKDADRVFPVIKKFNENKYNIWYDEGIDPGNEWPLEIERALKKCSIFLVFITKNSVQSRNVRNEINYALANDLPFLAIYLEETELIEGLGLQMGSTQAIMKYRMDDAAFYYKSSAVFEQMGINSENREQIISVSEKSPVNKKKNKLFAVIGAGAAVIITGIVLILFMVLNGGAVNYRNDRMGIAFSHSKTWTLIQENNIMVNLYSEKLESELYFFDITDEIIKNMQNGQDFTSAAETAAFNFALIITPGYEIYDFSCTAEELSYFTLNGEGYFSYGEDPPQMVNMNIRQYGNRIILDMLVNPTENSISEYYEITEGGAFKIDPAMKSIIEQVAVG